MTPSHFTAALAFLLSAATPAIAADDLLIADFEGADYGAWKTEGTAFGRSPAPGALSPQRLEDARQIMRAGRLCSLSSDAEQAPDELHLPEW